MKFILNKDLVQIEDAQVINSGTINYYLIDVDMSEEWKELYTELVIFKDSEPSINRAVANAQVSIDQALSGEYILGFVGYKLAGDTKVRQISTNLIKIKVEKGAGEVKVLDVNPSAQDLLFFDERVKARLDELNKEAVGYTFEEKADYLEESIDLIKSAIESKGVEVGDAAVREYSNKIDEIKLKPKLQEKSAVPSKNPQIIEPDANYDGLSSVSVAEIQTEQKTVKSIDEIQVVEPTEGKFIDKVIVDALKLQEKEVEPSTEEQVVTVDNEFDGMSKVSISSVTAEIDSNIKPENIKRGVTILNTEGTLDEGIVPTGTIDIVENGNYNVTNYADVNVNVPQLDTSDATANETNIEYGKTAYINGEKVEGALYNIGEDVLILSEGVEVTASDDFNLLTLESEYNQGENIIIEDGKTTVGITADYEDVATAVGLTADKLMKGNTVLGVEGTAEGGGSTGYKIPNGLKLGGNTTIPNNIDTSEITDGSHLFYTYGGESIDLSDLNLLNVTTASEMFANSTKLTKINGLNLPKLTNTAMMFNSCSKLVSIPQINTANVTNLACMFQSCNNLKELPILDTSKATDINGIFNGCNYLPAIPELNTSRVENMNAAFSYCKEITTIPLLDTSNCTNTKAMFRECSKLVTIPELNTSRVKNMEYMFSGCSLLVTVPLLDTSSIENYLYGNRMTDMFTNCTSLSNESLNNILKMCSLAVNISNYKTLKKIGLSQAQAQICQTLSNWDDFVASGWTSGY